MERTCSNRELVRILSGRAREHLKNYLSDVCPQHDISIKGKVWGGKGTARTFRFKIKYYKKQEQIMFAKLSPIFPKLNPGLSEYAALNTLYPEFLNISDRYGVPKPIAFFTDLNVLLMESVGNLSVKKYLTIHNRINTASEVIDKVQDVIGCCGQWLRLFHNITERGVDEQFNQEHYYDSFKKEYAEIKKAKLLSEDATKRIDTIIGGLRLLDINISMPCAMWHCDFTPGHIFVQENGVKVIDILGVYDVPIYEDIGKWLATSATFNTFPVSWNFDYHRMISMNKVFLDSYRDSNKLVTKTFVLFSNLYRLKQLVLNLYSQYQRIKGIAPARIAIFISVIKLRPLFESNINHALDCALDEYHRLVGN